MGKTDRGEHPLMFDEYVVRQVDASWLQERPWECIYMMSPDIVASADNPNVKTLAEQSAAVFIIDDAECTRCAICVERCPSDALWLGRTDQD